jgi:hypothetical protein
MAIKKSKTIVIDLSGPQGNAFYLLAVARSLSNQLGLDHKEIETEMTSGDYENLVSTLDKYFGDIITIYR